MRQNIRIGGLRALLNLIRELVAYADILASDAGQAVGDPVRLIVPMLQRFIATDREFVKARRAMLPTSRNR